MLQLLDKVFGFIGNLLGIGRDCAFHSITGLYCPGCGGTRAIRELLRGNLRMSLQYHPLVLYAVFVVLLELLTWGLSRLLHRPGLYIRHYRLFVYVGAAIIVANWFYKDYMLVFRGVNLLPLLK